MTQDEKLNEIAKTLSAVKTDISWLREAWSNQSQWCQRNEDRLSKLETDMAQHKAKPGMLMIIITILSAVIAGLLGWLGAK